MSEPLLVLFFGKDYAIKIAADKIAKNYACIYSEYLKNVEFPERNRHAEIIECIRNAVGEATYNEKWDPEQEWKILFLAGELHG